MEKRYIIRSDLIEINSVLKKINHDVDMFFTCDDLKEFILGIYEMLINAVEHGNLSITYEMKKEWLKNDVYEKNLSKLIKQLKNKQIFIDLKIYENLIIVKIRDEGSGFSIEEQVKKQSVDNILRESGRGIIIAKHFFDDVCYNEKGNEVTVTKILKR